jgi:hypothetical protein
MLVDGRVFSVLANSTANIFAGQPMEFLGGNQPNVVRLLLVADAAGCTAQWLMNVGGTQNNPIGAGVPVNVAAAAGEGPKDDEDTISSAVAVPVGARSQLNITNSTGGNILVRYRAIIQP